MKKTFPPPRRCVAREGVALIIVLGFIVIMTVLVIAFFSAVSTDSVSSKQYANAVDARQLADAAVQIVAGQIRQGTSTARTSWASQPGMIRTYDTTGNPATNYKLYSSSVMTASGALTSTMVSDYDVQWNTHKALWTDLNSPVIDNADQTNYPILDPTGVWNPATDPDHSKSIQGFSIDGAPTTGTTNPAPMPVQWLYQLRDGTLAAAQADQSGGDAVTVTGASASNPIVGRIAFWTDDETCKINLNTAGGDLWDPGVFTGRTSRTATPTLNNPGAFWDTPRLSTLFDHDVLAAIQPVQYEYQRYPGLPSTVYLAAAFPKIATRDELFALTPRLSVEGSSRGGSTTPTGGVTLPNGSQAVKLKRDRLYASVDELLFKPTLTNNLRNNNSADIDPSTNSVKLARTDLEQARFFITANSRAPEVNLFGQPRVAIWPINKNVVANLGSPYGTAYDQLIAFCAHSGKPDSGIDYLIQRSDSTSPTNDYQGIPRNQAIYAYLQNLTSQNIPGFGSSFTAKYGADRDQILTEIFDYIRSTDLADTNLAPANQFTKYTSNQQTFPGSGQVAPLRIGNTMGFGRFNTLSEVGVQFIACADGTGTDVITVNGQKAPAPNNIPPPGARWPYSGPQPPLPPSPAAPDADDYKKESNQVANNMFALAGQTAPLTTSQKLVQAVFLMNPFSVSQGHLNLGPNWTIEVTGLNNLTLNGINLGFPADGFVKSIANSMANDAGGSKTVDPAGYTHAWGSNLTFRNLLVGQYTPFDVTGPGRSGSPNNTLQSGPNPNVPNAYYPFVGRPTLVTMFGGRMTFATGTISAANPVTIKIYAGTSVADSTTLVQTINVDLSQLRDSLMLAPGLVTTPSLSKPPEPVENWWSLNVYGPSLNTNGQNVGVYGRMAMLNNAPDYSGAYLRGSNGNTSLPSRLDIDNGQNSFDIVRTLVPGYPSGRYQGLQGDYRLVAGLQTIPTASGKFIGWVPQSRAIGSSPARMASGLTGPTGEQSEIAAGMDVNNRLVDVSPGVNIYQNYYPFLMLGWGVPTVPSVPGFVPRGGDITTLKPQVTGDFDNGTSYTADGAFINKPDEGDAKNIAQVESGGDYPYFDNSWQEVPSPSYFSPNRTLPSPGMFGSLPTGLMRTAAGNYSGGWETLLFRPSLQGNGQAHPNAAVAVGGAYTTPTQGPPYQTPPDHLLMDLFWMPTVEPYAISTPFSTAGKINLNYQIAPFTYITRSTAVMAALKSQRLLAMPQNASMFYKIQNMAGNTGWDNAVFSDVRHDLNLSDNGGTLTEFKDKFAAGDIFRSASQICDIDLVPKEDENGNAQNWPSGSTQSSAASFWGQHALTGDNSRERPYANLYGMLTTKSDSYTVHFRVQSLQKVTGTDPMKWVEDRDRISSEFRGSSLIERYLDPSDPDLPDFADPQNSSKTLENMYKFRVVSTKKFEP